LENGDGITQMAT